MRAPGDGKTDSKDVSAVSDSKYPYVCSELFACEVMSMLDVMFEHPDLLELLFSFLDRRPPLDPSGAGYFRKVVVVLIQRKYEQVSQSFVLIDVALALTVRWYVMPFVCVCSWSNSCKVAVLCKS
jgi:hypothetical protein